MIYNVKDFGALGNGIKDAMLSIQAAIDAANLAGGGEVYLPQGTYIVTGHEEASDGAILLHNNITLFGDGMGKRLPSCRMVGVVISLASSARRQTWKAMMSPSMT